MRMLYKIKSFGLIALLFSAVACNEQDVDVPADTPVSGYSDSVTISGTLTIPAQTLMQSRGGFGETAGADLKLTLLEFDLGTTPELTTIANAYQARITSATTAVNNGVTVNFDVTLLHTISPKVLHLVVADDYISMSAYGSEASILPSLLTGATEANPEAAEAEAYWGRVEFPNGYSTLKEETDGESTRTVYVLRDDVKPKLTAVPVIRNFAMITVSVAEGVGNFELVGFDVVNVPTAGTVAPWNAAAQAIPTLLDAAGAMKNYTALMAEADPYHGIMAPGALIRNQESDAKEWTTANHPALNTATPVFMYEHPFEATRRTYLIVQGIFTPTGGGTPVTGFYKLDIGNADNINLTFNYYNIIRNIRYNVVITEVSAAGMATVGEAISRAPYNNLISATETSSMLNVSDGKNMLIVNDTNHIIVTEDQQILVLYRYIEDVTGTQTVNNNKPTLVPADITGPVVKSFTKDTYTDAAGAQWVRLTITPNAPTDLVQTQNFSIVDGEGLGRVIHLVLRKPWQYASLGNVNGNPVYATVAQGHAPLYPQVAPQDISNQAGAELTVYFNLPEGLPESMFPLEFRLEALKQGIENNKMGTLVVKSGYSLFESKKDQVVMYYVKNVSYQEYMYQYKDDTSNDVDVNKLNTNHTVRCRFTTINSVTSGDDAEIMIHNPYFSPNVSVTFYRRAL